MSGVCRPICPVLLTLPCFTLSLAAEIPQGPLPHPCPGLAHNSSPLSTGTSDSRAQLCAQVSTDRTSARGGSGRVSRGNPGFWPADGCALCLTWALQSLPRAEGFLIPVSIPCADRPAAGWEEETVSLERPWELCWKPRDLGMGGLVSRALETRVTWEGCQPRVRAMGL